LEAQAALAIGEAAKVLRAVYEQIVRAHEGGKARDELLVRPFAVEPLLQIVERRRAAVAPAHQQLSVDRALEAQRADEIGEGRADVLAGSRIEPAGAAV
jgi:hypothetical protein